MKKQQSKLSSHLTHIHASLLLLKYLSQKKKKKSIWGKQTKVTSLAAQSWGASSLFTFPLGNPQPDFAK